MGVDCSLLCRIWCLIAWVTPQWVWLDVVGGVCCVFVFELCWCLAHCLCLVDCRFFGLQLLWVFCWLLFGLGGLVVVIAA